MSYVTAQCCIPKKFGRKVEPNLIDIMKVFALVRQYERPESRSTPALDTENGGIIALVPYFNKTVCRQGELPSVNAHASARGLAKLAALMVNKGEIDGVRIMGEETVQKFEGEPTKAQMYKTLNGIYEFTQGGAAIFRCNKLILLFYILTSLS